MIYTFWAMASYILYKQENNQTSNCKDSQVEQLMQILHFKGILPYYECTNIYYCEIFVEIYTGLIKTKGFNLGEFRD